MFPRNAYSWWISVNSPPLAGVYGIRCCMHLVSACMLLNISLYCGNSLYMYVIDLVAVSLVSWIVIIAGLFGMFVMSCWRLDSAVFSDDAFQEMICVLWLVLIMGCGGGGGFIGRGGGCEYSVMGSWHLRLSRRRFSAKKGNLRRRFWRFRFSLLWLMYS